MKFGTLDFHRTACIASRGVNDLSAGMTFFLMLYLTKMLNFSTSMASIVLFFYGIGAVFGSIFSRKSADFLTEKNISIFCLILKAILLLSLIYTKDSSFLMINVFLLACTDSGFWVANTAWIFQGCQTSHEKLRILSMLSSVSNIGMSIAILLFSFFFHHYFYFLICSIAFFCLLYATFLFFIKSLKPAQCIDLNSDSDVNDKKINFRTFFCVLLSVAAAGIVFSNIKNTGLFYLERKFSYVPLHIISFVLLMNLFLVIFLQVLITKYVKKYETRKVICIGILSIGCGMLLFQYSSSFTFPVIGCLLYTLGEMLFFPGAQLLCAERENVDQHGEGIGSFYLVYTGSAVAAPLITGYMFRFDQSGAIIWQFTGVLCLIAFALLWPSMTHLMRYAARVLRAGLLRG